MWEEQPEGLSSPGHPPQVRRRGKSLSGKSMADLHQSLSRKLSRLVTHQFHGVDTEHKVEELYELGKELGKGAFGVVREAQCRSTGVLFCCKSIPREALTAEMFANIQLEAEIMMHLRGHAHVVEIMGLFQDDTHIHIVEELCSGGDLYSKLTQSPVPYTEIQVATIMRSVLEVLEHCHAMGVMYRDCKPDNFLLSTDGPDAILKATDFGISRFVKPGQKLTDFCGTPTYMAPEVFDMNYSLPADVWSAGVTMYWLLTGQFPFKGRNKMELAQKVCSSHPCMKDGVWDLITPEARDCVKLMLRKDPASRPSPTDMLQHKWFKDMEGAHMQGRAHAGSIVLQRMRVFAQMHGFKKEVMRYITQHLSGSASLAGLKAMFSAMQGMQDMQPQPQHDMQQQQQQQQDTHSMQDMQPQQQQQHDGALALRQVAAALETQGAKIDMPELKALLLSTGGGQDGAISFLDFASATMSESVLENQALLRKAFTHFDTDNDGVIGLGELGAALRAGGRLQEPQVLKILNHVKKQVSGQVDFTEFCCMMLESEEHGTDGLKLRQRVREAVGAIFGPNNRSPKHTARGSLPNLQPLSRGSSASGSCQNTFILSMADAQRQGRSAMPELTRIKSSRANSLNRTIGSLNTTAGGLLGRSKSITGALLDGAKGKAGPSRKQRRLSVQYVNSDNGISMQHDALDARSPVRGWSSKTQTGSVEAEPSGIGTFFSRFSLLRPASPQPGQGASSPGRDGVTTSRTGSQGSLGQRQLYNNTSMKQSPQSTVSGAPSIKRASMTLDHRNLKQPTNNLEQRSMGMRVPSLAGFASLFDTITGRGDKDRDSVRSSVLRRSCLVTSQTQLPQGTMTSSTGTGDEAPVGRRQNKRISWSKAITVDERCASMPADGEAAAIAAEVVAAGISPSMPGVYTRLSEEDVEGFISQLKSSGESQVVRGRDEDPSALLASRQLACPMDALESMTGVQITAAQQLDAANAGGADSKPLHRISPFAQSMFQYQPFDLQPAKHQAFDPPQFSTPNSKHQPFDHRPFDHHEHSKHLELCYMLDVAPSPAQPPSMLNIPSAPSRGSFGAASERSSIVRISAQSSIRSRLAGRPQRLSGHSALPSQPHGSLEQGASIPLPPPMDSAIGFPCSEKAHAQYQCRLASARSDDTASEHVPPPASPSSPCIPASMPTKPARLQASAFAQPCIAVPCSVDSDQDSDRSWLQKVKHTLWGFSHPYSPTCGKQHVSSLQSVASGDEDDIVTEAVHGSVSSSQPSKPKHIRLCSCFAL